MRAVRPPRPRADRRRPRRRRRRRRADLRRHPRRPGRGADGVAGARPRPAEPRHRRRLGARRRRRPARLGEVDVTVGADGVRNADGVLAGSDLSLDQAVRNLVAFTGCDVPRRRGHGDVDAGRLLGLADRGRLAPGGAADVTVLERRLRVVATIVGGEASRGRWRGGRDRRRRPTTPPASSPAIVGRVLTDKPAPVLGLATGSSPLGAYGVLVDAHRRRAGQLRRRQRRAARRVRRLPPIIPSVPHVHPPRADRPRRPAGRPRTARTCGPTTCRRVRALRAPARRARRRRRAAARHRVRRPHRVQRAGLVAGVAHADQDADRGDAADNARFFAVLDDVPRHVVTQGLATILDARHLLLVATGAAKAAPIAGAVEGPLTAMCPASVLQLHPHATVVVDEARRPSSRSPTTTADVLGQAVMAAALTLRQSVHPGHPGAGRSPAPRQRGLPTRSNGSAGVDGTVRLERPGHRRARCDGRPATTSSLRRGFVLAPGEALGSPTCRSTTPHHANDGPTSAFVILDDGSTIDVPSTETVAANDQSEAHERRASARGIVGRPALVPWPAAVVGSFGGTARHRGGCDRRRARSDRTTSVRSGGRSPERNGGSIRRGRGAGRRRRHRRRSAVGGDCTGRRGPGHYAVDFDDTTGEVVVAAGDAAGLRHGFVTVARLLRDRSPTDVHIADGPTTSGAGCTSTSPGSSSRPSTSSG